MNTKQTLGLLWEKAGRELTAFIKGNFYWMKRSDRSGLQPSKPRIEFIDLAKGVCILLVVIFHSPRVEINLPGVAALRMPLYFILSGLFFKTYGGLRELTEKKINKIIIPFLFFIVVDIAWRLITDGTFDWRQFIYPATNGQHLHNIPIWFLCSLFFSNLIFCCITVALRSKAAVATAVAAAGAAGIILTVNHIYLPFYLTQSLNGLPFFYLGYILRSTQILTPNRLDRFNLLIAIALLAAGAGLCLLAGDTPRLDFYQNHFNGQAWMFYPVAITMVGGLLFLCKAIRWLPVVSYLGRYSIIVLGLHQILLFQLRWARVPFTDHKLMGWSLCAAVVAICWMAIPLATRLLPWVTAQRDWFRLPALKLSFRFAALRRFRFGSGT